MVTDFTGVAFAYGTSVGAGQVLEFYANFAMPGVLIGFLVLGFTFGILEMLMGQRIRQGRPDLALCYAMPGLALIAPQGNLIEILVTFIAAIIVGNGLSRALPQSFWQGYGLTGRSMPQTAR